VLIGLSADPALAQPLRALAVPPRTPSPEAQQAFQATIDAQARLLAGAPRLSRVPKDKRQALVEFVVGNVLFVATHELGQAVLSETSLPAVAGTEQAADDFAVLAALQIGEKTFSDRILIEAARGWFTHARRAKETKAERAPYYDRHDFNLRRAYRIVCLTVGADPARFKALAEDKTLAGDRRLGCGWNYHKASQSWDIALKPHRPAADQPKARIDVSYGAAAGPLAVYAQVFHNLRFLETIAEFAADRLAWRAPIRIEMRSCGDVAAWTAATRTLHVCYETAQDFAELYRDVGRDP